MTTNQNTTKKEVVKMPMTFSQSELDARLDQAKYDYMNGVYTYFEASQMGSWSYPATEVHTFGYVDQMVDFLIEAAAKGQARFTSESIHSQPGFHSVRIFKPADQIEADLAALYEKVKAAYIAEIEEFNATQKALLVQQLVDAEEAKEKKKEEDRKAKLIAQAEKDAESYFQSILNKA